MITHIIHFDAQSHVQNSFTDSLQYIQDNIVGTHNLLEVNRLHNEKLVKFIHVSTDEVYGKSTIDANEKHKQKIRYYDQQIHMLLQKQVHNY